MVSNRRSPRIKLSLFIALAVACGICSASARLGETRSVLTGGEGRYGEPTGETTRSLKSSQEKVDVFKKDKITVTTEYDEDGKVWRISFQKKGLNDSLIANLLRKNVGSSTWSKASRYMDNRYWMTLDKQYHAVYYGNPVYKLVIMTEPASMADREPQTLLGPETKRVAEEADPDEKPEATTKDPLEGF